MSITNYGQPVNIGNGITIVGIMANGIAGENLVKLNICSFENGQWVKATTQSVNILNAICLTNTDTNQTATLLLSGFVETEQFTFPLGTKFYLSLTPGITSTDTSNREVGTQIEEHLTHIEFKSLGSVASVDWSLVQNKPLVFPPETHLHPEIIVPTQLAELQDDSTHRLVTDTEKTLWNTPSNSGGQRMSVELFRDGINTADTNQPAALRFFKNLPFVSSQKIDLTGFTQIRLNVMKGSVAGNTGSKVILRYIVNFSTTAASWLDIGTSEVSVLTNVQNQSLTTGWIDLAEGAKGDVHIGLLTSGGNANLDPQFGNIGCELK